jgi:hypothetical protein
VQGRKEIRRRGAHTVCSQVVGIARQVKSRRDMDVTL